MFLLDRVRSSVQMLQDQCCHSFLWESLQICRPCQTELTMLALGKRALGLLMRNPVGPDKRSLFCLLTEFQESFSSPSSHGPPAGLHNRVASGHSGHAPHSYSGEGETGPTWQISATLTRVPTSGPGGPFFLSGFHHSVSFLSLVLQSWWVWSDSEITDLWYNCFHDNVTDTWLCAASSENGRSQTRGCLGGWLKPSKWLETWWDVEILW